MTDTIKVNGVVFNRRVWEGIPQARKKGAEVICPGCGCVQGECDCTTPKGSICTYCERSIKECKCQ